MNNEDLFKKIISHCKEYGFIFPSSEIYDGLSAVYDYGQNGVELKNNLKEYWWRSMTLLHENVVGIDAAIFMHPQVWKASGHVDQFNDPMIDNKDSRKRYRVDHLIEEKAAQYERKGKTDKAKDLLAQMEDLLKKEDLKGLYDLVVGHEIADPVSGTRNWTEVRQFNLMFDTQMGSVAGESDKIYLRPETAQGIFVNFLNVQKTGRMKIPFGIAQVGKAFRNEIVARQFLFRMREFEQMEMQFFVKPGDELKWYGQWKERRMQWHRRLGFPEDKLRFKEHTKLAHYANAAVDIEYEFPIGFKEMEGVHSRTDYDLKRHQEFSGKKLQYFDGESNENYVPYVVETSVGLDRTFLAVVSNAYREQKMEDGSQRVVLNIHPALAPVKVAVFPLVKKDGLPEKAAAVFDSLKYDVRCYYEEKDTIGRRYRRQDAIGTPYCITVDHQTLQDDTVTLRHRESMQQERVSIRKLMDEVKAKVSMQNLLKS